MTPLSPIHVYHEQQGVAKPEAGTRSRLESREEEDRRKKRRHRHPTEADEEVFEVDTFEHADETPDS